MDHTLQAAHFRLMVLQMVATLVAELEQVKISNLQLLLHTVEVAIIHSPQVSLHPGQSITVEAPPQVIINKLQATLRMVAVAVEPMEVRQQAVVLGIRLEHQSPDLPSHQQHPSVAVVMLQ